MRASAVAEAAGIPSVSIIATGFIPQARTIGRALGIDNARIVEYPGVPMTESSELIRENVVAHVIDRLIELLTQGIA
jgi:hypothetical protein